MSAMMARKLLFCLAVSLWLTASPRAATLDPVCNNDVCEDGENCENCIQDCYGVDCWCNDTVCDSCESVWDSEWCDYCEDDCGLGECDYSYECEWNEYCCDQGTEYAVCCLTTEFCAGGQCIPWP